MSRDANHFRMLEEVALRAKVSPSTVSRVLSGKTRGLYPRIAERNERIRQIADHLNYRPSFHAKALRLQRTCSIALLYARPDAMLEGTYAQLVQSAAERLEESDYHLTLYGIDPKHFGRKDLFLDRQFDGALVHHGVADAVATALEQADLPAVLVNGRDSRIRHQVAPDDRGGTRLLVDHLLELGHRRFVFIQPEHGVIGHYSQVDRQATCSEMLRQPHAALDLLAGRNPDVPRLADELLTCGATAAICYSASTAALLVAELVRRGISVPGTISVASFSDREATRHAAVPVTVVDVPFPEIGRAAAELLLRLIESRDSEDEDPGESNNDILSLPESLTVRASTGPAAGATEPFAD